jgi:phosphate transport system permease protein
MTLAIDQREMFNPRGAHRRRLEKLFTFGCLLLTLSGVVVLGILLVRIWIEGSQWLSVSFLTSFPSIFFPEKAGIKSALYGSVWLIGLTTVFSVPVGVAAAIYLQEYARDNWLTRFVQLNIANLAGVPSIVYGILGLAVFVRWLHLGRSVAAGALTLSLLILPVIIITSREALAAVPKTIRLAAYSLGATQWQTIRSHVLPAALPGILTGVILSLSRAIGEAAPLIMVGGLTYVAFVPEGVKDEYTALPLQIYNWCDAPQKVFHELAAAGIIVLLFVLLTMNAIAIAMRGWQQRRKAG